MRTIVFSVLPLLLSLLAGCGNQEVSPVISEQTAQENEPAVSSNLAGGTEVGEETLEIAEPKNEQPCFWSDRDAAEAIKALGYSSAWVYRWQNGSVEATVLFDSFDSNDEQERWDFKSREISTGGGGILDKPLSSGVFVVAVTRQSNGVYKCRTGAHVLFDDGTTGVTYAEAGEIQLPPDPKSLFSNGGDGINSAYVARGVGYLPRGSGENEGKFVKINFSPVSDEQ